MTINDLWAKTKKDENGKSVIGEDGLPVISEYLLHHMKEVGATAERILNDSLYSGLRNELAVYLGIPEDEVVSVVKYICAMHDIGKCHPLFQRLALDLGEYASQQNALTEYRHEIGSEAIAKRIWTENKLFDMRTREFFATILRLHHQRKGRKGKNYSCSGWEGLQNEVEKAIRKWSGIKPLEINGHCDAACTLIAAILIISDWIASSNDIEGAFKAMRLAKAETLSVDSFKEMFGFEPRTLQKDLEKHLESLHEMPIISVIEAPMGEGKTEAGLFTAYKMAEYWGRNGFYFALPTAATSNQMVVRVRQIIGENGNSELIHSTSWLTDDEEQNLEYVDRLEYLKWKGPKKRALLARFGVGTVDQAMITVMKVRYGVLRILGLANKVLIVDELHSYDAYMSTIIERLVEWCRDLNIPVVMMSATLPIKRKAQMLGTDKLCCKAYPLVTEVFSNGNIIELPISTVYKQWKVKIDYKEHISDIPAEGCTLILANTVKKAIEIYEGLNVPNDEKLLFHSRFTVARRSEIEKMVTGLFGRGGNRPSKMILVATQVVEQSMDVDFDRMYTELAPIDLVLQRIGRLHRHDIPRPASLVVPRCTVFADGLGTGRYVYYELLLERSMEILKKEKAINIPSDIPSLIEAVYRDEPDPDRLKEFFERQMDTTMQKGTANSIILPRPDPDFFCLYQQDELWDDEDDLLIAQTRLGANDLRICIVPSSLYDKTLSQTFINTDIARELYQYMVSAGSSFKSLLEQNDYFYGSGKMSGCVVVRALEGESPTETLKCIGMRVDRELGLVSD